MNSLEKNPKTSSYAWLVWGILVTIYFLVFFHRLSVGVITEDLVSTFGMSATQLANLGAMYFYAYTIMQIPSGILADSLGPKKTVIIGSLVATIGVMVFSFASSILIAYLGRLLVGLGVSVVFLCLLKIQGNWFPSNKFASMSGLTSFIGSMGGILAQGPLLAMVDLIGWRNSFRSIGFVTLVLAGLVGIFVKNTPSEKGLSEVNPQQNQPIGKKQSILSELLEVIKNPKIWAPAIAFSGVNGGFLMFTGTFGVPFLTSVYGLDKGRAATFISILLVASGVACILVGKLSDSIGKRKLPMIVLALCAAIGWGILILFKPPVWFLYIFIPLLGAASSMGVICWSVGKEVSNPRLSGMALSIVNVCGFLSAALLPIICGKIIDVSVGQGLSQSTAYLRAFIVPVIAAFISVGFTLLSKETNCGNIYNKAETEKVVQNRVSTNEM